MEPVETMHERSNTWQALSSGSVPSGTPWLATMSPVRRGALLLLVSLSLTACATQPPAPPRVVMIETETPVLQKVPEEHTDRLEIPHRYPEGEITTGDVEARLLACEAVVARANASRTWIRNRQGEKVE